MHACVSCVCHVCVCVACVCCMCVSCVGRQGGFLTTSVHVCVGRPPQCTHMLADHAPEFTIKVLWLYTSWLFTYGCPGSNACWLFRVQGQSLFRVQGEMPPVCSGFRVKCLLPVQGQPDWTHGPPPPPQAQATPLSRHMHTRTSLAAASRVSRGGLSPGLNEMGRRQEGQAERLGFRAGLRGWAGRAPGVSCGLPPPSPACTR